MTFSVGRLVNLLPLVFVLDHGRPQTQATVGGSLFRP